jgi:hypothetical protein
MLLGSSVGGNCRNEKVHASGVRLDQFSEKSISSTHIPIVNLAYHMEGTYIPHEMLINPLKFL